MSIVFAHYTALERGSFTCGLKKKGNKIQVNPSQVKLSCTTVLGIYKITRCTTWELVLCLRLSTSLKAVKF